MFYQILWGFIGKRWGSRLVDECFAGVGIILVGVNLVGESLVVWGSGIVEKSSNSARNPSSLAHRTSL